jgi:hypothetical protein
MSARDNNAFGAGGPNFESISLQRGVNCEPDFQGRIHPLAWDAFLDFFMPVQDKLRADGMRNIYAYGYQLTANGVDPIPTYNAFLIAYGGKNLVTLDGRLNTSDPQVRAAAAKAIEKLTTPFKKGYVPPGVVNWNDADDNNAFHAKLMKYNDTAGARDLPLVA